jgi:molecular chaperone GrpE
LELDSATVTNETDSKPTAEPQDPARPAQGAAGPSIPPAAEPPPSMTPPAPAPELLEPIRAELEAARAERDKLREQLLRTAADFDNFRKRSKRDIEDARSRSRDDLVRDLLPVFDNLERAVGSTTPTSDVKSVVDGIRMVLKLFEDSAERLGLHRVKSVGERFDPALHEAIQQLETHEQAPGTIVREIVAGYRFGERLVRPAMVVVARKPAEPAPAVEAAGPSAGAAPETTSPSGETGDESGSGTPTSEN